MARLLSKLRDLYGAYAPRWLKWLLHPMMHPRLAVAEAYSRNRCNHRVAMGPCRGLRLLTTGWVREVSVAKLLGTYEMELHPIFDRLRARPFTNIVDIGAAEGYYAVGLLLWRPDLQVLAYEMNSAYRDYVLALANENGVGGRLALNGYCDVEALRGLGDDLASMLLIVDVEGYEKELLDPAQVPALLRTTMIVEVHDCFVPGCTQAMRDRFAKSHVIHEVQSGDRNPSQYPIDGWMKRSALMANAVSNVMADGRTEVNGWLLLEPRTASIAG